MLNRYRQLLKNQSNVKVIALAQNNAKANTVWFATLAAGAFAFAVYFFSFFFGFTGGRALTER